MSFKSWLALALLALVPPAAAQNAKPEDLPVQARVLGGFRVCEDGVGFLVLGGSLLFEAIVIHADRVEPVLFLLDTGSLDLCRVDPSFLEKMGMPADGTVSLKIGQQQVFQDVRPVVEELTDLRRFSKENAPVLQGRTVSGVVGFPIFAGSRVQLDYGEFRLRFLPLQPAEGEPGAAVANGSTGAASPEEAGDSSVKVPFRMEPLPLCCDVSVNQSELATFQIATALAPSWVKKDFAAKARWRKGKRPSSLVAGGVELEGLAVVDFAFREWKEGEPAPPVAGALGNDFLFYFVVTVDLSEASIVLKPLAPPPPPPPPVAQPTPAEPAENGG